MLKHQYQKWYYLVVLTFIWGSSYILIKKGLVGLTPMQMGTLRIVMASVMLLLIGMKSLKNLNGKDWFWLALSGFAGTFIPTFCFAFAQTEIDSNLAAILNSLTPLMTLLSGVFLFGFKIFNKQVFGVLIGFIGSVFLVATGAQINPDQNIFFVSLIFLASCCYALNVNLMKKHLQHVSPMAIAVGNFVFIAIPALVMLCFTDFFRFEVLTRPSTQKSLFFVLLLAIFGTVIAKVMFNKFVQIASPVFASSVTYTLPIVAVGWGMLDGETFTLQQALASAIILFGVWLSNRKQIA